MHSTPKFEIAMKINICRSIFLCIVAFSVLFLALPAFAETVLQVKCVDASGTPVKDVKVVAFPLKPPSKMKDKKSDAQGMAEFKLEEGAYRVFGRKEGFEPAYYEFAVLKGSPVSATLKIVPGADKKLYFEDPAEEKKAQDLMMQGLQAIKENKFAAAEKLIADSIAVAPSNAEAYYYLAVTRLQQQKYDEAVQALDKAAEVASAYMTLPSSAPPGSPNPYEQVYKGAQSVKAKLPAIKAEDALRNKNYDQAAKEFSELIKSNPNEPGFHASLAVAQYNLRKYDEAIATIDTAIKLKPGTYEDIKKTILVQKEKSQLEQAQALLDQGTKLFQDGDAAAALKKFEEAKALVVAQDRQWPIWRQIGRAQGKLNQPEAVASFKKAIELAPADKQAECRNALAQYYLEQKKYDEAVDVIADPKSESPEKALLGVAKTTFSKEPKMARAALERVLKINPDNLDAGFDLGQLMYFDKDSDARAKELLTRYVEKGQDADKVGKAKDMMILLNRRTK
jgi:tetratricopeptide (TPR) repeat protein